ncbi:nuc-1 negative regulatory protein preg [Trichoderma asperellum]|uniref:Nuc-1 negative regulatory protein preg n=1 Tax=Trichoderma asperellum TaxID=101201 RepID=A0A6V8R5T4_TRIAP|nr:nuc-1 negative regulatory protein preg [Trichoderma asperellum]
MLKTSPILSPSANASPTSFRNASSTSSQESASSHPSQLPAVSPKPAYLRRRLSTESEAVSVSASSSALSPGRSRRTGASTSDIRSPAHAFSSSSASPLAAPTTTTTKATVTTSTNMGIDDSQGPTRTSPAQARLYNALSPNKRRLAATAEASSLDASSTPAATASSSNLAQAQAQAQTQRSASPQAPKRARPEEQPPRVLPNKYEFCPVEHMVELIAHMLGELIATNDAIRISSGGLTRFHSRTPPGISVRDYLHRLARHATLTPPLLLAMVYYIDRLCALYPEFTINTLTVHRFLITAATVAAKGLSDSFWNNTTYARVGGVRVAELRLLELEFLYRVDWRIVPNPEILVAYYQGLVQRAPGYELESDGSSDDGDDGDDDDEIDDDDNEEDAAQQ